MWRFFRSSLSVLCRHPLPPNDRRSVKMPLLLFFPLRCCCPSFIPFLLQLMLLLSAVMKRELTAAPTLIGFCVSVFLGVVDILGLCHRDTEHLFSARPSHLLFFRLLSRLPSHSPHRFLSLLLDVRGHLQGGSSLSSSMTSSAARRVRQLPQLPPKSSTVEQGRLVWK